MPEGLYCFAFYNGNMQLKHCVLRATFGVRNRQFLPLLAVYPLNYRFKRSFVAQVSLLSIVIYV
jgi:hypothetical protein